jgi:2-amino-4-hydroxy-6-hydroxymethyldihydropteridine diphosphokinase
MPRTSAPDKSAVTTRYAIALGSNRRHGRHGAPAGVLRAAMGAMRDAGLTIEATAPILHSVAIGPAGRGFANSAAIVSTPLDPPALLALLKRIERAFGRRRGQRWGARVVDLDIALWSGGRWPVGPRRAAAGRLAVPHVQLAHRDFVLVPLARIAANWREPWRGRSVRQLLGLPSRRHL